LRELRDFNAKPIGRIADVWESIALALKSVEIPPIWNIRGMAYRLPRPRKNKADSDGLSMHSDRNCGYGDLPPRTFRGAGPAIGIDTHAHRRPFQLKRRLAIAVWRRGQVRCAPSSTQPPSQNNRI
jgi:hypothetical protein